MHEPSPTRRRLLTACAAAGATVLAGCFDGGPADDGVGPDRPAGVVPDGSRFVLHADVSALLDDDALRSSTNDLLSSLGESRAGTSAASSLTVGDGLDQVQEAAGLDPRGLSAVAGFGDYAPDAPIGGVVWSDWTTDDVRDALSRAGTPVESEEYGGQTILAGQGAGAVGVLDDGTFAVGEHGHVETVLDVAAGDATAIGGDLRTGFDATASGAIRLAFLAPEDVGAGSTTVGGVDPEAFRPITHGYGAYEIDGDARRSSLSLETESADDAATLRSALETLLSEARGELDGAGGGTPMGDELRAVVEATGVSTDGATVTLSASDSEAMPLVLVAAVSSFVIGLGSQPQPVSPQVLFEFDYEQDAGLVTVTHAGGDHVRADELSVRGHGIGTAAGADVTEPGQWAGSTSADVDGTPAVSAGDSAAVGVTGPAYELSIVWESADGSASSVLATDAGPEA